MPGTGQLATYYLWTDNIRNFFFILEGKRVLTFSSGNATMNGLEFEHRPLDSNANMLTCYYNPYILTDSYDFNPRV